jgi:hypothetical protein
LFLGCRGSRRKDGSAPTKLDEPYRARCPKEGSENAYGSKASHERTGMRKTKTGGGIVESGRIGKQHSTIGNGERTGERARWSAPEALPQTPPGGKPRGKPPETPGPFPSDLIVGAERDPSRVRQPRQKRAPLTDPSRPGTRSMDQGKGPVVGRPGWPAYRRSAPKSGFKLERERLCLTKPTFSWKKQRFGSTGIRAVCYSSLALQNRARQRVVRMHF